MSTSPPPALFQRRRRRNPTKRRRPPPSPPSSPSPSRLPTLSRATRPPSSTRLPLSARSQLNLRPPPVIPGYDESLQKERDTHFASSPTTSSPKSPPRADYSTDGLHKLRMENTRQEALSRQRWGHIPSSNFARPQEDLGRQSVTVPSRKYDTRHSDGGDDIMTGGGKGDGGKITSRGVDAEGNMSGIHSIVRKADPFSEAWREGLVGKARDEQDGDVVLVDDYVGVVGVDAMDTAEAGESDGEWEKELLRRAGQGREDWDREMGKRVRRVLVNVDGVVGRNGKKDFERCLKTVREAMTDWKKREELGKEQLLRLEGAVAKEKGERSNVESDLGIATEKARFYRRLREYLEDICDMLKEKRGDIEAKKNRVLKRLEEQEENVKRRLKGDVDEFGRMREASLNWDDSESGDEADSNAFWDVREEVSGLGRLQEIFGEWKQSYEQDYKNSFGDANLGKLAGRLILGSGATHFEEVRNLNETQRVEMWKAAEGGRTVAGMIRAKWRPRLMDSCEEYGWLAKDVIGADADSAGKVLDAFRERLGWEVDACVTLRKTEAVVECFKGTVAVAKIVGKDVGLDTVTKAAEKLGLEEEDLTDVREELLWIASGRSDREGVRIARRMCEKGGVDWTFTPDSPPRSSRISA